MGENAVPVARRRRRGAGRSGTDRSAIEHLPADERNRARQRTGRPRNRCGSVRRSFDLLEHARQLHRESGGAFDIAIAPLVRCWGFMDGSGRVPDSAELEVARQQSGMEHVHLTSENPSPSDSTAKA